MDWIEYRELADRDDVMTRLLLEHTRDRVDRESARAIDDVLAHPSIDKPVGFRGDCRADLFFVAALESSIPRILDALRAAGTDPVMIKQWESFGRKIDV